MRRRDESLTMGFIAGLLFPVDLQMTPKTRTLKRTLKSEHTCETLTFGTAFMFAVPFPRAHDYSPRKELGNASRLYSVSFPLLLRIQGSSRISRAKLLRYQCALPSLRYNRLNKRLLVSLRQLGSNDGLNQVCGD